MKNHTGLTMRRDLFYFRPGACRAAGRRAGHGTRGRDGTRRRRSQSRAAAAGRQPLASFGGMSGHTLLLAGLVICGLGLVFGLIMFAQMRRRPVHRAMLEISELIYETCKTYLITQGKFLAILWVLIGAIIVAYFGFIKHMEPYRVGIILAFSVLGIAGSYGVAWFGIRMNTFANSRTAFASLAGKGYPCYAIPLQAGMSIGMLLISVELFMMLCILLFVPGRSGRGVLHRLRHRRVARRLGPAHRRRHLHQDRRHRQRPHEDRLQDQGRRRPQSGRHRRLHGRQRGRLGRPDGRRLRDLRRDRRGPDRVHPAGRADRRRCRCSCSSGSLRCG